MTTLSIRLPESLHKGIQDAARREGISINQFITVAVAEKLSALLTEEYIQARAAHGSRDAYEAALAQVPDIEADEYDRRS
ncbi:MAG: toxin-antitoxin system HicB family antitoxin [Caldilineaceae bacterium]|nr:toxin-antitoxin system HicB family antitoxin [Caldilineaceae bacterium]